MISLDAIVQWFKANYVTVFVAWVLLNLLIFVFVSAFIDWYFFRKNRKNVYRFLAPHAKAFLMAKQNVDKEEDLDCSRSVLETLIMAGSGFSLSLVARFLVEGPHIKEQGIKGIIDSKNWFEFALFFMTTNYRIMTFGIRSHLGIFILHGIVTELCVLFWGLLPFVIATMLHYDKIQEYVSEFNYLEEDRLIKEDKVAFVDSIKYYQEVFKHLENKGRS